MARGRRFRRPRRPPPRPLFDFFCLVRIGGREYIDAGIGRISCFYFATEKAADLMVIIDPVHRAGWPLSESGFER